MQKFITGIEGSGSLKLENQIKKLKDNINKKENIKIIKIMELVKKFHLGE